MTVIGFRTTSFKGSEGDTISGMNIYVSEALPADKGEGQSADRLFFTMDKLLSCKYSPSLGDEVRVEYNKYGKPAGIYLA